ncbi:unnamed protein product [Callosobruchus maculatus]|uniref:Uncharacterized protein n=1 Tax=Callosobruchus maculatus TaxID=64391 RepID=A0A653CUK7_CALMS|nr:unnamed protein product [Callosobruchus maculatus]
MHPLKPLRDIHKSKKGSWIRIMIKKKKKLSKTESIMKMIKRKQRNQKPITKNTRRAEGEGNLTKINQMTKMRKILISIKLMKQLKMTMKKIMYSNQK